MFTQTLSSERREDLLKGLQDCYIQTEDEWMGEIYQIEHAIFGATSRQS